MAEPDLDEAAWRERLREHRANKRRFVREELGKSAADRLGFFALDPSLRVVARLQWVHDPDVVSVEMTRGPDAEYEHVATLGVELDGDHRVLAGYRAPNQDGVFVPFADATSGDETPGMGRYLELDVDDVETGSSVALDFNLAYLPFSVLDDEYASPRPPERNRLPVAVRAGERYADEE